MGSCFSSESRSPLPVSPTSSPGVKKSKGSRSRLGSRNSSFDHRKEDHLHRIPGRLFLNGHSEIASLFTQQGRKGTNQDAMIVWENFASRTDTVFCGVFDGHGPYGHMVAKRVRDVLPLKLNAYMEANSKSNRLSQQPSMNTTGSLNSEESSLISADEESKASFNIGETEKHSDHFNTLKESFLKSFRVMDRDLRIYTNIDCFCSGTTAVALLKQGLDLVIGNIGDSRAILGTREQDGSLIAVQLTVDLKPDLPEEAERIRKCKGRVFALRGEPEVARVWLPNNDSPGLAMARAFGDFCLKDFGLISVPDISYRRLTEKDDFVVLATDGIWDVLSNKEVVDIVAAAPSRSRAARLLVETAVRAWRYKFPTSKVDDCAVVCLFLDSGSKNLSAVSSAQSKDMHLSTKQGVTGDEVKDRGHFTPTVNGSGTFQTNQEVIGEESKAGSPEQAEKFSTSEEGRVESGQDWSALEGVSRVNTLLTLPRFVPEEPAGERDMERKKEKGA